MDWREGGEGGWLFFLVPCYIYLWLIFHDVALFIINNNYVFDSLQPHNILLSSKENSAPIKIADFGVDTEIGEEGYVTSGRIKGTVTNWSMHPTLWNFHCNFMK